MTGPVAAGGDEFAANLTAFVKDNRLYGAAAGVVHRDDLVWSGGAGLAELAAGRLAGPDVLYRIASITKTFTGTAIMQLRDAGQLDLDQPVVTLIPELAGSGTPAGIGFVTIRRLLSHESGLVSEPPGTDFAAAEPVYEGVVARTLERVAEIGTVVPPSTQPKYCNLGYQLLGEIVRRVSGLDYPQYIAERITRPLGLTSTGFEPLVPGLSARRATGYSGRSFSDELAIAPAMPPLWAEGGLWSDVGDLARWLSFQLAAHAEAPAESPVLAAATRREMHKPRYLSDETWSAAWGISWYAARQNDVTWVQHSGGLPGFTSNICFDRASGVGAIVLLNGIADASGLAMSLAGLGRDLALAAPPQLAGPAPTPDDLKPLLGLYAPPDLSYLIRLEWRDGQAMLVDSPALGERTPLERGGEAGSFVVAPGFRQSGETLQVRRRPDGGVTELKLGGRWLRRLDPADLAADATTRGESS